MRTQLKISALLLTLVTLWPVTTAAQTIINLTSAGAGTGTALCTTPYTKNGACFEQGPGLTSAGSGLFDPFYQLKSASTSVVQGYNTGGTVEFETVGSGVGAATPLLLSTVTQVKVGTTLYREFFLDINQTAGSSIYAINNIQIWKDNQSNLQCLTPGSPSTWGSCDDSNKASLVYFLDDGGDASVKLDYSIEAGSGRRDMRMLVPDAAFNGGPQCDYGQAGCGTYIYHYSKFGEQCAPDNNCAGNDDGFEEWATAIQPFVQLSKTASGSYNLNHTWTIDKSVDPTSCSLFAGQSCTPTYQIVLDETETASGTQVSGTVTLTVPAKLPDADENSPNAVITSISDIFNGQTASFAGTACATVPFTVNAGTTVNCAYTLTPPNQNTGTNTVTAVVQGASKEYVATAAVSSFGVNHTGFQSVNVTDDLDINGSIESSWGPFSDDGSWTYPRTYTCSSDPGAYTGGTYSFTKNNRAKITENNAYDDASVAVTCYAPTVSKTALPTLDRTHLWSIQKSVNPAAWYLFTGDTGTSDYTVAVTKTGTQDSGWGLHGAITVNNPNPGAAMTVAITDALSTGEVATVDCGGQTEIAASGSLVCTYVISGLPSGAARTNTATATMNGIGFQGSASVDFSGATVNDINATVHVTDNVKGALGTITGSQTFNYSTTFACDTDEGAHGNTATITETSQSSSANVDVTCYKPTVSKTASTTFSRDWTWDINKVGTEGDADQGTASSEGYLLLSDGQSYIGIGYTVTPSAGNTDSGWAVSGTITITNPNPHRAVDLVSVVDVVSPDVAATVDCPASIVPAAGSLECTYSASLPDGSSRTNTATATQQNYAYNSAGEGTTNGTKDYSGSKPVTFDLLSPTVETDECVDVFDTWLGSGKLGTLCASLSPSLSYAFVSSNGSFPDMSAPTPLNLTYGIDIVPPGVSVPSPGAGSVEPQCGDNEYPNTASLITNDNAETASADWWLAVQVACETGCTLTQGYWKTHSEFGKAPYDDNWAQLPSGASTVFFLSGQSWYQVFWTAPAGNVYYSLAHQWMAAKLNTLNGADAPADVLAALASGQTWFETYTPVQLVAPTGNAKKNATWQAMLPIIEQMKTAASLLASYNEGLIGPGHCDEDFTSVSASVATPLEAGVSVSGVQAVGELDSATEVAASEAVALESEVVELPTAFGIGNYPNPFNPATTLRIELPEASRIRVTVYDVLGRVVARPVDDQMAAGTHSVTFDAGSLPSGVYLYRLEFAGGAITRTMQLLK